MFKFVCLAATLFACVLSSAASTSVNVSSVVGVTTVVPLASYSTLSGMSADHTGRSYDLGYVNAGAYVAYTLNVPVAGVYSVLLNYAQPNGSSQVSLLVNGSQQTQVNFSATGSWSAYYNSSTAMVTLPAGQVNFELYTPTAGFNLGGMELQTVSQTATPVTTGATIVTAQAATKILLSSYSTISGMSPDSTGLGYDLGYTLAGGYVDYPLSVAQAGKYSLVANYASPTGAVGANILVDGVAQPVVSFANTGSWANYADAASVLVTLPAGLTTLRVVSQAGGFNLGGLTLAPATALSPLAYYVSPTGNDANDGKTTATAFATLQKAANVVQPGFTVYVMAGTYQNADYFTSNPSQNVLNIQTSGTKNAPIVFTNYPGQSPVIKFNSFYGIRVIGAVSYLTLSGFEIIGDAQQVTSSYAISASYGDPLTNGTGISVTGDPNGVLISTHVTIQNMVVHECPLNGIGVGHSDYITIQDNVTYNNAYWSPFAGSGISVLGLFASDSNTQDYKNFVMRNISHDNYERVPNFQAYNLITDGNGILFDSFNHQGASFAPYLGRTLVANNLLYNNGGAGISAYQSGYLDIVNNTAFANTLNMTYPIGQITGYYGNNLQIVGNIMVPPTGKIANTSQGNVNVTVDYNLYFGGSGPQMVGPHDIIGDPLFVDPTSSNFQLQVNSLAVNTGIVWPYVTTDLLNKPRPGSSGSVDKGAYQR